MVKDNTIDFRYKINAHFTEDNLDNNKTEAINKIIEFILVGFNEKNNFFINDFNIKSLIDIKGFYSKFKTNILNNVNYNDYINMFNGITFKQLKCMIFIFTNYTHNHLSDGDEKDCYKLILDLLNEKKNNISMAK